MLVSGVVNPRPAGVFGRTRPAGGRGEGAGLEKAGGPGEPVPRTAQMLIPGGPGEPKNAKMGPFDRRSTFFVVF